MTSGRTIRSALEGAARALGEAGLSSARREAQVLLGHVLGGGREAIFSHPGRALTAAQRDALDALVARRGAREPAAYILGAREFWSLDFLVTRDTLIPRPDSETVVEAALAAVAGRASAPRLLDLGTGAGCLLLALLSELPEARGVGVDISPGALEVARANAGRLGLGGRARFVCGDWGRALAGRFDLIVANPPYVEESEIDGLAPEVAGFEPRIALDGAGGGLAAFRELAPDVARLLAPDGVAAIEVGAGQAEAVAAILAGHGLIEAARRRDIAGIERCIVVCKP